MSTTDESVTDESTEETETTDEQTEEVEESSGEAEQPDPDAGAKKALVAERKARKDAERRLRELEAAHALKDKPVEEQALEAARQEARQEALQKANERIARAEVKAAAAGKVKNPALALKLIDISEIEVDEDGEVDSDAVATAIADLIEQYPELSANTQKFGGTADQGARNKNAKPSQLSREELKKLSPQERLAAYSDGRVDSLLGRQN